MTYYHYNELNEVEQHEVLWEYGVHIGGRLDGEQKIILYQIFSFYVELIYRPEYEVLRRLRSFSSVDCLDTYMQQVDLSEIGYLFKR